jgi:hypothetical protein
MPILDINFAETPDVIPPIPPGEYTAEIQGVPEFKESKKGGSTNLVVVLKLISDNPAANGRTITDYTNFGPNVELRQKAEVKAKKIWQSAGLPINAAKPETEALAGKTVKVRTGNRTYKDKDDNEVEGAEVKAYL